MTTPEGSYYELLGVPKNASTNEIRQAFRHKALASHPDRGGDPEMFQVINKAYDVLSDPERRKRDGGVLVAGGSCVSQY